MLKLTRFLKDFKLRLIVGPTFKLIEAVFELIVPLVMASVIDVGVKNGDVGYVFKMGGVMVTLGVLGLICALICQYNAAKASQGFGTVLRSALFKHINLLSHSELDKIGAAGLITRITNDTNQLQLAVAMLIRLVIRAPFLIIGSAVAAVMIDWQIGLIFIIMIPVIAVVIYLVMSRCVPLYKRVQTKLDEVSLVTRENLSGVRVIRAFSKQEAEIERFYDDASELKDASIRVGKISALLNPATYVILNAAIICILWFSGIKVNNGRLEQGQIIALVQYMTQILLALVVVANLVVIFTKAAASARRVNEVFETTPSVNDNGNVEQKDNPSAKAVEFINASFGYGNGENALENITLSIEKGETVGIIGGTGSGKSTLIKLIARFYDVTEGEIYINGNDIKKYPLSQLKKIVALVPQKAVLFSGTIAKNIKFGNPDADDATVEKAIRISQSKEFISSLNDGLEHQLSRGGKNLSGGQRQRLTIARAIAANPQILVLDDSSSALDYATDAALRKAISEELSEMTLIIVSQRAAAIKNADKIVVMDDGRIVGCGKHRQLLEECEVYSEICSSQLSATEEAEGGEI